MELGIKARVIGKKSENKRIRREGGIPAVVYSRGKSVANVIVDGAGFAKVLHSIEPGTLSAQVFTLNDGNKSFRAILKDIQYEVTTYRVDHLDFVELHDDVPVTVKIPLRCVGIADCVGIKLGGFLRQVINFVKVKALPKHLPSRFEVDISKLDIGQSIRLSQIEFPKNVVPIAKSDQAAVVITRRQ